MRLTPFFNEQEQEFVPHTKDSLAQVALVTSPAIGDSLLLMTVAHNLRRAGSAVTVFGPHIHALRRWFPGFDIRPALPLEDAARTLRDYGTVIQLHDGRPLPEPAALHPRAMVLEHLCRMRSTKSMAQRLVEFCRDDLALPAPDKYNGLVPPDGLEHRAHASRVVIHPTASTPDKCWLAPRFVALALRLRDAGLDPQFVVSPAERPQWEYIQELGLGLPQLGSLENVAAWLFASGWFIGNDSGIGHLASNLHVPTLSLFMRHGGARTWRPDWGPGRVLVGGDYIPTGKLKEKLWKYALTSGRVARDFSRFSSNDEWQSPFRKSQSADVAPAM